MGVQCILGQALVSGGVVRISVSHVVVNIHRFNAFATHFFHFFKVIKVTLISTFSFGLKSLIPDHNSNHSLPQVSNVLGPRY